MSPVKYFLIPILFLTLAVSTAGAAEELTAAETVKPPVVVEKAGAVGSDATASQAMSAVVLQSMDGDDTKGESPAVAVEKPAAVQTASWAEIKRKFRDR